MRCSTRSGLLSALRCSFFLPGLLAAASCVATGGADGQSGLPGVSALGTWRIDTEQEWMRAEGGSEEMTLKGGAVVPDAAVALFRSRLRRFDREQRVSSITVKQSDAWLNWEPVPNLGPDNLRDAPVFLAIGEGNYWAFGRYGRRAKKSEGEQDFVGKPATLAGFDGIELVTTPFENQFDAPGGRQRGVGGYHAWQSRDMVNWVHHGPVTEGFSRWVTSAEHVDGKTYIFYDFPNDQDPHVYEDDDLFDGRPGKDLGLAFADPSHGSDAGFIRDLDGRFHVIYEDWSPINAREHSWDSPLAGHAVSETPAGGYQILAAAVDQRTHPTGEVGTYKHPHWVKEAPDRFPSNVAEYEIHEPEQDAFGDWAIIAVGGQYYLFGDHDPATDDAMAVGWFTAPSLDGPFEWCGRVGRGHPDPDIGFAEGRFYLFTQQSTDYVSDGPWVDDVEVRVGVDTDDDGRIDVWSEWATVQESYQPTPGFSKQIARTPATLELNSLPAGSGVAFELRLTETASTGVRPVIDMVELGFR